MVLAHAPDIELSIFAFDYLVATWVIKQWPGRLPKLQNWFKLLQVELSKR